MKFSGYSFLLFAFLWLSPIAAFAAADEIAALLARAKSATGGARWDSVRSVHATGVRSGEGLSGDWRSIEDLPTGRHRIAYRAGSFEHAAGYDGKVPWRFDPGGEVAFNDAAESMRRARTQAWIAARAWWFPERGAAEWRRLDDRRLDGRRYRVAEATPRGGDPVALWFDADTGVVARVVQRDGQYAVASIYDDWRDVDGVKLPFRVSIGRTGAAGRSDERLSTHIRYGQIALDVAVSAADFAAPPMTPTARIDEADGVTRIPFQLLNNHIFVDAEVDGRKARFLVDTGALNLVTPAAARRLGLVSEGRSTVDGAGEGSDDLGFAHARSLHVGAAVLDATVFAVIDLGDLPKVEGIAFDGFVGYELFRRFGATIDYAQQVLTFTEPDRFTPPPGAVALTFEQADRAPIIEGAIDGVPVRLWVDTGSRGAFSAFTPYARRHGLIAKYGATAETVVGWGVGGAARAWPARLGRLVIGPHALEGLVGDFSTSNKGALADPDLGAILGGGAMRRFTVAFDYARKQMYLAPNEEFSSPARFDRSGLWLLADESLLAVTDVAPGSGAARAGLRVGDRIAAIDGEAVSARAIGEWRARLADPALRTIVLERWRAGSAKKVELVLSDRVAPAWPATGAQR